MEGLVKKFFKHALRCKQCHEHPDNPCAIGAIILSAAASAFIISAQHRVHADAGESAVSTSLVQASAESTSQTEPTPTQRG